MTSLNQLLTEIRGCSACYEHLPLGANPVVQAGTGAKILIAGQAPGIRVHQSGLPFTDPSGDRLRTWLGVDNATFYDANKFAIVPMGFCYPGTSSSGDLPPRPECANLWCKQLLAQLTNIELTIFIGQYAQHWHLPNVKRLSVANTVMGWRDHAPAIIPLPHPSPRNNRWLKKNLWFEQEVIPYLQARVHLILAK